MPAIRRILVAVKDPESTSQPAVAKAARLAKAFGARLELFHAITDPLLAELYLYADADLRKVQRDTKARDIGRLEAIAAPLREQGLSAGTAATWDFPPHEAIVRHARRHKIDLIVAECHQGRRLAPWLLHLTDWELLRTSPAPVLLVKTASSWENPNVLAAIDPSHAFAKPAKLDARILTAATAFTTALKGTLHVVHAYSPLAAGVFPGAAESPFALGDLARESDRQANEGVERAVAALRIPRKHQHVVRGMAGEVIPQQAKAIQSGLVVMGAISRSGWKRAFIGNTAERVLSSIPCDVLVVKPLDFKTRVGTRNKGVHFVGLPMVAA